jgi:hypothetical protein
MAARRSGYAGYGGTSGLLNCATAATIAVTILAGPLNYLGANPKVTCHLPQPSK